MKKNLFTIGCAAMLFTACSTTRSGVNQRNASQTPDTEITSFNKYDLEVSSEGVSYTIDISTPEGRMKLNKLKLHEAENLALTEAVMKYNCATLVNPQYTNFMRGKKVLRITVFGFPAKYKNQEKMEEHRTYIAPPGSVIIDEKRSPIK